MTTRWADVNDVKDAVDNWSDEIVQCRIYGHLWEPHNVVKRRMGYTVTQRCDSCGNRRWQDMDLRGYAQDWHYQYVEDYRVENLGRIEFNGRAVLRLATLRNMTIEEVDDE